MQRAWLLVLGSVAASTTIAWADTTVLVGTAGTAGSTLTSGIKSFAVTNSGDTWTQSPFNSDGWDQTIATGVGGLTQDIYGNVYAAVNTGDNDTRGIRIYRQTGGASVGYLNSTWGSGNLTGNNPDGLALGPNGQLYATIAFGDNNNKLISFDTAALSGGEIQTGQAGTDTNLTGLSTPRGMTIASDGNFYIANRGTRQILRWTGSGTTASVLDTNNTSGTDYQGVSWDAGNNLLLTRSQTGAVGSLTLAGVGSDNSIRVGGDGTGLGVAAVEGQVAFTQYGNPATSTNGTLATAVSGNTAAQTNRASLLGPLYMMVLRDTRLWSGGTGDWNTGGNWQQGIDGGTGAATFTDGSGGTSLPSVLTFTGSAGGTATNNVSGTVNVGGLNFAPAAGSYTLSGSSFTLAPDANIRNLSTNTQTISADIVLAGDQWVQADPGSSLTIAGTVSGSGAGLTKLGSGTLTLSGSSSYSGTTTISAGTLEIGSGGTTGSVAGNITNNATLIFNRSDALTYSGTISGSGDLTKLNEGVLTLSGSNTYSGNTTVSSGVLAISNTTALPGWNVAGRLAVASGAALAVGNSVNDADVATLLSTGSNFQAGAAIGFDTTAGNRTYAAAIGNTAEGSLGLVKLGSNTLMLSGNNTYAGTTTISAGTLEIGSGGTTGSVAGNISNNATLIFNRSDALTYSGTISGSGALTKLGSGVLVLSGPNTYSGNTTVSSGVLAISNTTALPGWNVAGRLAVASGAALAVGNSVGDVDVATLLSTGSNFQAGAAIGFDTTAGNRTYAAAIGDTAQGSLGLVKVGSGTLTLSGSNTYSGGTTISEGIVAVASAAALPTTGTVSVADGSQLQISGNQAFSATLDLAGDLSGQGSLRSTTGTNEWSGPISVSTPTTRIEAAAGTLTISGEISTSGDGNLVFQGNGNTTVTGKLTGTMQPFRSSGGTGIVTLSNPLNDFSGGVGIAGNVSGPTLRLGASEVIPHGAGKGNLRFTGNSPTQYGVLDLAGQSETINGLQDNAAGAAIIDNRVGGNSTLSIGAGDTTSAFLGTIQNTAGTVAVTKIGSGTLTLSGPNTYSGDTTISAGTLALGVGGSLANSAAISVASGATFDVSALTSGLAIAASQTLGGTGSILGSLAFGADSKLAFGSSLTVNSGTVTFNGFGINDIIGLDGSLVSAGTYTLLGGDATFDLTNALDVGAGNAVDIGGGKTAYLQEGSLQVVVVPEPAGMVVAGVGIGLAFVAAARRRRW